MHVNVGRFERMVRVMVGLALLSSPFWLDTPWRWLGLIGLMPLATGLAGRCPAYRIVGVATCRMRKPG